MVLRPGGRQERRLRAGLWVVGALLTAASGAWVALQLHRGQDAVDAASLVGLAVAVVGLVVAVAGLRLARAALGQPADSAAQALSAAATLARQVERAEAEQWRRLVGGDRKRINLRYSLQAQRTHGSQTPGPHGRLFDDGRQTEVADIAAYYRATVPARLVVTGAPGAGKTVLALELLLDLIEHRGETDPVPVRMSLAAWDTAVPLDDFLISHLVNVLDWPLERATQLVEHGLVLPFLDGLDEMDPGLDDDDGRPVLDADGRPLPDPRAPRARAALNELNAYGHGRAAGALVLTCRTTHYEALLDDDQLRDAAHIRIDPVAPGEALRYLEARSGGTARWQRLLEHLRTHSADTLARTLSTPWRLSLTATVYSRTGDPGELLAHQTPQEVDEHLLALLIPATLDLHPPRRGYTPDDTRRWLARIARSLQYSMPGQDTPEPEPLAEPRTDIHLHQLWPIVGESRLVSCDLAVCFLLAAVPVFVEFSVSSFLWLFGIFWSILLIALAGSSHTPHRLNWRALRVQQERRLMAFVLQVLFGLLALWVADLLVWGFTSGLASATAVMIAIMLVVLAAMITGTLEAAPITTMSPAAVLRSDLLYRAVVSLPLGMCAGLIFGLIFGLAHGVASGLLVGVTLWLSTALGIVSTSALWRYCLFLLFARRVMPFRLNAFLAWSYEAGLLRMSGNAYQFRHREFQDWLAESCPGEPGS
ncbi:hypothetical protein ACWY4P_23470 [Streptomyces sp. LZ34]